MKPNKLAVFDIDGTLTDSVAQHQVAFIRALDTFGFKNFNADFGSYEHHTDTHIFVTIFEQQNGYCAGEKDIALFEDSLLHFISLAAIDRPFKEIEGAKSYLECLRKRLNVDIVFATGSLLKPAKLKLQQAGIFIEDELLVSANNISTRDEIVLSAINAAKQFYDRTDYQNIFSFGDGRWDFETAERLKLKFIGIANEQLKKLNVPEYYPNYSNPQLESLMNSTNHLPVNFNFSIHSSKEISKAFTDIGIFDFQEAAAYVKKLPYKRNANKYDLTTVLTDGFGTCSTKHALLKRLGIENGIEGIQLVLCIFKMNAANTPKIASTLKENGLEFMLEAHNYLLINGEILDCTNAFSGKKDFIEDTIQFVEIEPDQINEYKVNFHKEALQTWLRENSKLPFTLTKLYEIREQCIAKLSV